MHIKRVRLCQRMGEFMGLKYAHPSQVFYLRIRWPTCVIFWIEKISAPSSPGDHRKRRQSLDGYMLNMWVASIFHLKHMSCPSQPMLNITASLSNHFDELSLEERSMVHTSGHNLGICSPRWRLLMSFVPWVTYIHELLAKSWAGVKL